MKYNMNILNKTLDNSLHVILIQKPDYVKSLFMLGVPAGGFDVVQKNQDEIVKHSSGCAHFLEHQMFRLNQRDVTQDFAKMQAQTNAFTSYTETAYYFQTTSDIEKPLALLLDFVENLDIDQQSVEKEKGIILSEYNMYEQNPEQRLLMNTWRALYHKHPLKIDILGNKDDISNMTPETLTQFYQMNYDPSRLTLVGVTGKDINKIMDFVIEHQKGVASKIQGDIARIMPEEPKEVVLKESIEYMDITMPYVCVAYKLNPMDTIMDAMRLDIALQMRMDSLFGPLNPEYQTWMDEQIISQVAFAECDFNVDHGYVIFVAQTYKVQEFIDLVDKLVKKIKEPIDPSIYHALSTKLISQNIRSLDSFDSLAIEMMRAHFENYDYLKSLELVKEMDPSVIEDLCSHLDFSYRSIIEILPNESKSSK